MGRIAITVISNLLSQGRSSSNSSTIGIITIMLVNKLVISTQQQKYSNQTTVTITSTIPITPQLKVITAKDSNNNNKCKNNSNNHSVAVIVVAVVMLYHNHRVLQQSALSINTNLIAIAFLK